MGRKKIAASTTTAKTAAAIREAFGLTGQEIG
ncbi:MAG: hypothetical protein RLZZ182_411 [Pseudomonadota bacterium]|jgi:hypothetical protein